MPSIVTGRLFRCVRLSLQGGSRKSILRFSWNVNPCYLKTLRRNMYNTFRETLLWWVRLRGGLPIAPGSAMEYVTAFVNMKQDFTYIVRHVCWEGGYLCSSFWFQIECSDIFTRAWTLKSSVTHEFAMGLSPLLMLRNKPMDLQNFKPCKRPPLELFKTRSIIDFWETLYWLFRCIIYHIFSKFSLLFKLFETMEN